MKIIGVYLLVLFFNDISGDTDILPVIHRWTTPVFKYPSVEVEREMTSNGSAAPNATIIIDVDRHEPTARTFVTLPKFLVGANKVTLGIVSNNSQLESPALLAYPDWSWHRGVDCDGLISVLRVKIDKCDRLWIIDSGRTNITTNFTQTCPPKLLVFDLTTDLLIKKYIIPSSYVKPSSIFVSIEVDTDCFHANAYVADSLGFQLLVYNFQDDRSWIINSPSFERDPNFYQTVVSGRTMLLPDGIIGLALSPGDYNDNRILYYHSLASNCENYVFTSILKNESNFLDGVNMVPEEFHQCFGVRESESSTEVMDNEGNLFFGFLKDNAIYCWNSNTSYNENILPVIEDDPAIQVPTGVKVVETIDGENVWILSARMQGITSHAPYANETNFFILRGSAEKMAKTGGCQV